MLLVGSEFKGSVVGLLWVGEVVVDLLVEDVEYDVEEVPAEEVAQLAEGLNENIKKRGRNANIVELLACETETYHMKKKKPVTRAGYLSRKPAGLATLSQASGWME